MIQFPKLIFMICLILFARTAGACIVSEKSGFETTLLKNLAYGKVTELNQLSPDEEQGLLVRIHETPTSFQKCGLETDSVCQFEYLLTAASHDENPELQACVLRSQGELIKIEWLSPKSPRDAVDTADLLLTFFPYSRQAIHANPVLKNEAFQVQVQISPSGIQENAVQRNSE